MIFTKIIAKMFYIFVVIEVIVCIILLITTKPPDFLSFFGLAFAIVGGSIICYQARDILLTRETTI